MSQKLKKLYEAARTFNKTDWWHEDGNKKPLIFVHPQTQENYYVHYVHPYLLRLHKGDAGRYSYHTYNDYNDAFTSDLELGRYIHRQCIMEVEYMNREDLLDETYEEIKSLGLSFRGKKQWPTFTLMAPGEMPQSMFDSPDIEFFTEVLTVLPQFIAAKSKGVVVKTKAGWNISQEELEEGFYYRLPYINDLKAHRLKKLPHAHVSLEMTQFFMEMPVMDETSDKPYFPTATILVDADNGGPIWHEVGEHTQSGLQKMIEGLADFFLKHQFRPSTLEVEDECLFEQLFDFCDKVGIDLEMGDAAQAMEVAKEMHHATGMDNEDDQLTMEEMLLESFDVLLDANDGLFDDEEEEIAEHLFMLSILYLGNTFNEAPPYWTTIAFKKMLSSGVLDMAGPAREAYPVFERLLGAMERIEMISDKTPFVKLLKNHK